MAQERAGFPGTVEVQYLRESAIYPAHPVQTGPPGS